MADSSISYVGSKEKLSDNPSEFFCIINPSEFDSEEGEGGFDF